MSTGAVRTWLRRRGATAVEFGLLVGLIAIAIVVAITDTGRSISRLFSHAANALNLQIEERAEVAPPQPPAEPEAPAVRSGRILAEPSAITFERDTCVPLIFTNDRDDAVAVDTLLDPDVLTMREDGQNGAPSLIYASCTVTVPGVPACSGGAVLQPGDSCFLGLVGVALAAGQVDNEIYVDLPGSPRLTIPIDMDSAPLQPVLFAESEYGWSPTALTTAPGAPNPCTAFRVYDIREAHVPAAVSVQIQGGDGAFELCTADTPPPDTPACASTMTDPSCYLGVRVAQHRNGTYTGTVLIAGPTVDRSARQTVTVTGSGY